MEKMLNEKVENKKYGIGTIIDTNDNKIIVRFKDLEEEKIFKYPDAFDGFLTFENKELEGRAIKDIKDKKNRLAIERAEKMLTDAREDEEKRKEKLEIAKEKRKATKEAKKA
ncbi:hypothetical protein [Clostridium sp.]|uniref:hypothetical protein n=1 Tax=Clostridium sp. TaxID=1506 RepID=UPI00263016DF|nr:hypothetical protein [Clostridium sp.]